MNEFSWRRECGDVLWDEVGNVGWVLGCSSFEGRLEVYFGFFRT